MANNMPTATSSAHQATAKMTTITEDALRRRRERGRRSQAAFRKRQTEASQHFQDENHRLRSGIEKLVEKTRGDENPDLLNSIMDLAEEAGVHLHARLRAKNDSIRVAMSSPPVDDSEDVDLTVDAATKNVVTRKGTCGDEETSSSSSPPSYLTSPGQRLRCGLVLDHLHYMRISVPPDDILPYLGSGSNTLAGIIFWAIMDHGQGKCPRKHTDFATLVQRGAGHSKVTQDMAATYIEAMIEARQEYKRTGSISPKYASAAESDLGMLMRDRISAEYHARGMDPEQWLSAVGVEKRLRGVLVSHDTFAKLLTAARGGGDLALRRLFETVVCKLSEMCICFGDGPRWSVDIVDGLFLDWAKMTFWPTPAFDVTGDLFT